MCYPFKKLNAITCKKSKTSNKEIPIKITKEAHRLTTKQTCRHTNKHTYTISQDHMLCMGLIKTTI